MGVGREMGANVVVLEVVDVIGHLSENVIIEDAVVGACNDIKGEGARVDVGVDHSSISSLLGAGSDAAAWLIGGMGCWNVVWFGGLSLAFGGGLSGGG